MEYIKGKWYEINKAWYAKFLKLNYSNWFYLESITALGRFQENQHGANILTNNDIELADMNEVSKYLPEGHPDKVDNNQKFIVGDWYRCSCNTNLYRFHSIKDSKYFVYDAAINLTNKIPSGELNHIGYKEELHYDSLLTYFSPNNKADMSIVNKFIPKNEVNMNSIVEYYENIKPSIYPDSIKANNGGVIFYKDFILKNNNTVLKDTQIQKSNWRPSTKEAYDQQLKEYNLIEEAKKKYPSDTLFKLAHLNGATGIIRPEYNFKFYPNSSSEGEILVTNNNSVVLDKDGMSYCVYYKGKWAEIVEDKWIPKVGEYIYITMPNYTPFTNTVRKITKLHLDGDHVYCESLGLNQDFEQCFSLKNNHFRKALSHEIPNQSLVGRYYQRLNYSISSVQEGDYLKCYAEDNNVVWLDKYGYLSKDDLTHWKLMPEGFNPYLLDNFEIKLEYGSKGGDLSQYNFNNGLSNTLSHEEWFKKYWKVNNKKSKLIEVIPLQQVKELRQSKKSKLITI